MAEQHPELPHQPLMSKLRWEERALLWLIALGAVSALTWWTLSRARTSWDSQRTHEVASRDSVPAQYVGDRSCRECHPGESAAHSRSGHSQTLRLAAKTDVAHQLDNLSTDDPELPGVTWHYALREGQFTVERRQANEVEKLVIEYAFGSGHHATTFVTLTDRSPSRPAILEHRLTAFAHLARPGLTPGQSLNGHASGNTPSGRLMSTANTLDCFRCHSTRTSSHGTDQLDESSMIVGVSCERCHGPGGEHVAAARSAPAGQTLAMPMGPGRFSRAEEMDFCGSCHRLPEMITPGAIRTDNPVLVRHQPVGLMQSACFKQSRGALTCLTCHDPHARATSDRASYERFCLSCHQQPAQTRCAISPLSGCIDCHMPRRDVARGMMLSDHWIRKISSHEKNIPAAEHGGIPAR